MTVKTIIIDNVLIQLQRKRVKNINLRVVPPHGDVKVSAPARVSERFICDFVASKIDWIRELQKDISKQSTMKSLGFEDYTTHFVWGEELPVQQVLSRTHSIAIIDKHIILAAPSSLNAQQKESIYDEWLRVQIKQKVQDLIAHWQNIIGVQSNDWGIKKMKTKWGSCNIQDARIWINLELAKYPPACLEYVVVHELVHLHERYHNARFYGFMDRFLPNWREQKARLNQPLRQQEE